MDDQTFEDRMLGKLIDSHTAPLDPNQIAAYVDGSLSEREMRSTERRLLADPEAALLVGSLRASARANTASRWRLVMAVAAVVCLGIGLGIAKSRESIGPRPSTLSARLTDATERLRVRAPALFGDFTLPAADSLRESAPVIRGGVTWRAPRGLILDAPTHLKWTNPDGASRVRVALSGRDVRWSREVDGEMTRAPALPAGTYRVRIRALDGLAGQETRRTFTIVDPEAKARHAQAVRLIRESAAGDEAELLVAYYALNARLFHLAGSTLRTVNADDPELLARAKALRRHLGPALDE